MHQHVKQGAQPRLHAAILLHPAQVLYILLSGMPPFYGKE